MKIMEIADKLYGLYGGFTGVLMLFAIFGFSVIALLGAIGSSLAPFIIPFTGTLLGVSIIAIIVLAFAGVGNLVIASKYLMGKDKYALPLLPENIQPVLAKFAAVVNVLLSIPLLVPLVITAYGAYRVLSK